VDYGMVEWNGTFVAFCFVANFFLKKERGQISFCSTRKNRVKKCGEGLEGWLSWLDFFKQNPAKILPNSQILDLFASGFFLSQASSNARLG
jgi:hypothetical protein